MTFLLALYAGAGLLLTLLSIPLIQRRVKPNPWYGFRVRQTLENPDTWYAVNAHAGKRLLWVGIGAIIIAGGLYLIPGLDLGLYALLCAIIILGLLAASLVQSFRYLKTLDKS
jgi:hypothetical protein